MTPFYVAGSLLAAWALIVTALGLRSHSFPSGQTAERVVSLISIVLVAGAIGTGIVTAATEDESEEGHAAEAAEHGGESIADEGAREGDEGAGAPGGGELALTAPADGGLEFDPPEVEAEAGLVELRLKNLSPVPHNVSIEGEGIDSEGETVGKDEESFVRAELDPGTYTYYCSVAGHREGGMEGTLTVR